MGEYLDDQRLKFRLRGSVLSRTSSKGLIFLLKQLFSELLLIRSQCFKDLLRERNQKQIQLQHAATTVPENFLLVQFSHIITHAERTHWPTAGGIMRQYRLTF